MTTKAEKKAMKDKGKAKVAAKKRVETLRQMLSKIYSMEDLNTVCCRQCTCCRVACPQMKFCEATQILDRVFSEWSKDDKRQLLVTSLRYFFSDSLVKPCPLLKGNTCTVYEDRPLSCRMYGLWPEDTWKARVDGFAAAIGLPACKIPLNKQCKMVRRSNGEPPLPIQWIEDIYQGLDVLDQTVMNVTPAQIQQKWNTRTIHDWVLLKFCQEGWLLRLTEMKRHASPQDVEEIIKIIADAAKNL